MAPATTFRQIQHGGRKAMATHVAGAPDPYRQWCFERILAEGLKSRETEFAATDIPIAVSTDQQLAYMAGPLPVGIKTRQRGGLPQQCLNQGRNLPVGHD